MRSRIFYGWIVVAVAATVVLVTPVAGIAALMIRRPEAVPAALPAA